MRRECRERFPHRRAFSDPDMHHGTCVAHVPWCMSGSLTDGFLWSQWRGKRSRHSRHMRNPQIYVSGKRFMEMISILLAFLWEESTGYKWITLTKGPMMLSVWTSYSTNDWFDVDLRQLSGCCWVVKLWCIIEEWYTVWFCFVLLCQLTRSFVRKTL